MALDVGKGSVWLCAGLGWGDSQEVIYSDPPPFAHAGKELLASGAALMGEVYIRSLSLKPWILESIVPTQFFESVAPESEGFEWRDDFGERRPKAYTTLGRLKRFSNGTLHRKDGEVSRWLGKRLGV